ncbi:MAG: DUF4388 domain-containing protein [Chloroflexi bacterium]|uniref:DUF4388 domain-containing protein n=1 Tax=Candidatus Chlorohelix allophototropha TaxID=3003348 RepID=A0A8T7LWY1_9CHLR|nr:DUF4388 domain-containing protein [Chloroflexota bacterium]WJW67347.1 DUF4388 domain-containing protein [Chloroflexota bacterium L227-S17]
MSETRSNSFSIIELLQYIRRHSETGRLSFEESGAIVAELFFKQGHLIHASNDKVTGDDVVYQLLGNRSARIHWEKNLTPEAESVTKTDELLLLGALGLLTEDDAESALQAVSDETNSLMASTFEATEANSVIDETITDRAKITPVQPPTPEMPTIAPSPLNPVLTANSQAIEQLGQLQFLLGDEVLRPPRFRRWSGFPLPFVSAFVLKDSPNWRIVRNVLDLIWHEKFSGFLTLITANPLIEAVVILYKGRVVHSRFADNRSIHKDQGALRRIVDVTVSANERNPVLLYPLEADFIHSYSALIMGDKLLDSFSSASMKINKLLNTLEHSQHTGVVHITNLAESGYIFLSGGQKLGSYYEVDDVLEESIVRVYQIVSKPGSMIDVVTSPPEDKMFEVSNRPKSVAEIKQQMIAIANEVLGKRANRVVNLLAQAEDNTPSLKTYANQARLVTQMFIDKNLADQLYERFLFLIQELG